jgi:hypothetical protein
MQASRFFQLLDSDTGACPTALQRNKGKLMAAARVAITLLRVSAAFRSSWAARFSAECKPSSLIALYRMLGRLGKEKMQLKSFLSYLRQAAGLAPLCCVVLVACVPSLPNKFVGDLRPVGGSCDKGNRAVLTRAGSSVMFAPQDGVLVLDGRLSGKGEVSASLEVRGMNRAPYRLVFTGKVQEDRILGTYVTPRCRYDVTLAAP